MERLSSYEADRLNDALYGMDKDGAAQTQVSARYVKTDQDGTTWVRFEGADKDTPLTSAMSVRAREGDIIDVSLGGYEAVGGGNRTDPSAGFQDVRAVNVEVERIKGKQAEFEKVTAKELEAEKAHIVQLEADSAEIGELVAQKASIADLQAAEGRISDLESDHVSTTDLTAVNADITDLKAKDVTIEGNITAATGRIGTIEADYLKAADMTAEQARVNNLLAGKATVNDLNAATGRITVLESTKANIADIEANYITADDIEATYMHADMTNSDVAWIQNGIIKDGSISSAMINDVSANKLTAGTINGSVINVTNLNADNITTGTINGQRIGEGSLGLDKLSEDVYTESEVDAKLATMQAEIDGAIETWTGTEVPTLSNAPASGWTDSATRDTHVGDVYFVVNSQSQQNGYNYRFTKSGSTYSWQLIKDNDVTNALQRLETAEGKITSIESFDSTVSSFMTNTDDELESVKSRATSLETRMTDAEGDISDKVDTSTFNSLSQTVDTNTASITSLSSTVSQKADGSTVTALTNRVSTVEQDVDGIETSIGELQTTVSEKADSSTVTTVSNKLNNVSDTVDGHTQSITSLQNTVSQKADGSTVSTLSSKVNSIEDTVDGHTSQLTSITSTQTTMQRTLDKTVKSSIQLWYSKANTTAPSKPTSQVTSTSTSGNAWRIVVPAYNASYPNYYYCWQYEYTDGTYGWSAVVRDIAMGESQATARTADSNASDAVTTANTASTNASTALTTANTANTNASEAKTAATTASTTASEAKTTAETAASDASTAKSNAASAVTTANSASTTATNAQNTANANIKSSVQLWFTKANSTAPNKPTSVVSTSNANTANAWNLVVPVWNSSYPHYYYCYQQQKGDGTYQWTDVVYDRATSEAQQLANTTSTNLSTLQTDYATFKQTTEQFESTVGTRLTTIESDIDGVEERVSNNETSISNNASAIALKANSSDVYTKAQTDGLISTEVTNRNAAIEAKASEISLSVSQTYSTKTEVSQAVDGIQIGGRNRLLYTDWDTGDYAFVGFSIQGPTVDGASPSGRYFRFMVNDVTGQVFVYVNNMKSKASMTHGKTYVASAWMRASVESDIHPSMAVECNSGQSKLEDDVLTTTWHRYSVRFVYNENARHQAWYLLYPTVLTGFSVGDHIDVGGVKVEEASKPSDWTPSPDDMASQSDLAEAKAEIKITTDGISSEVEKKTDKTTIISTIRQSAETVKIKASQVEIDGTAIFTAISSDVDDAIDDAMDAIEVGGRNLVRRADRIEGYETDAEYTYTRGGPVCFTNVIFEDRTLIAERSGDITIPYTYERVDGAEVTLSFEHKLGEGGVSRAVSCYPYQQTGLSIRDGASFTPTDSWQRFTITTKVRRWTTGDGSTHPGSSYKPASATDSSYRTNGSIWIWDAAGTNSIILRKVKIERGNKPTDWTPAPEDIESNAVKRTQRIYWRSASSLSSWSMPTAWLIVGNDGSHQFGKWTTKVPRMTANADGTGTKYPYLYTCEQREMADGTLAYTTVLLDDSTTIIDGGNIITGSVAANRIDAASGTFSTANIPALTADHIKANVIAAVNNGTGTINADKINASQLTIGQSQVSGLEDELNTKADSEITDNRLESLEDNTAGYVDATFVPDSIPVANINGQLTVDKIDVDSLRAALLQVANLLIGEASSAHIQASGSRMSFMNGEQEVAYIDIDQSTGDAVFYMTRSIVVKDMQFGEGKWKWYKRDNGNMSLKWLGGM